MRTEITFFHDNNLIWLVLSIAKKRNGGGHLKKGVNGGLLVLLDGAAEELKLFEQGLHAFNVEAARVMGGVGFA